MNNKPRLEWRELANENSELYLISNEGEINCTELVREHYYLEDEEEVVIFDRSETFILNMIINRKRYIQLFDGSIYTIIDETGKIIFDYLEYLDFNHDSRYFTSHISNTEEYHIYSISNTEPEFTSNSAIEYDKSFDIFLIENEFGQIEAIFDGVNYQAETIKGNTYSNLGFEKNEIILIPVDDFEDDTILLISSNGDKPLQYPLEKYIILFSGGSDWIILNQFEGKYELIFDDGNCIRLDDNLSVKAFTMGYKDFVFEISSVDKKEKFLVLDKFQDFLQTKEKNISDSVIRRHTNSFVNTKEYFYIENKIVGNFLIIYQEAKLPEQLMVKIYWNVAEMWCVEVPSSLIKNPLLCLQYVLIDQSFNKPISEIT